MNFIDFEEMFKGADIDISPENYKKFDVYEELLIDWNKNVNLTAITEDKEVVLKHFIDSVLPLKLYNIPEGAKMIDVGTGAGFPSLPMKIMRDDISLTMLDSLNKRLLFLRDVLNSTGITAEIVHARAEDGGRNPVYREKYDVAVSRAVSALNVLTEYTLPFVKVGGVLLALKGSSGRDEAKDAKRAIDVCGGKIEDIIDYKLPNGDGRTLVIVKKVKPTPAKYPRNSAQIAKNKL